MIKLLVFIPCYNEITTIEHVIDKLNFYRVNQNKFDIKLLVLDDGSTDGLNKIYNKLEIDYFYRNKLNQGLGSATRIGMECAYEIGADFFIKFDADLQHRVEDIGRIVEAMIDRDLDIAYGSRFRGKITYKMPLYRRLGNIFFTRLMRLLTGWQITDAQSGLMSFSRDYLSVFEMPSTYNPPQQALLDGKNKFMTYGEIPVDFDKRVGGHSFISLKYIYKVFSALLKILFTSFSYRFLVGLGSIFATTLILESLIKIVFDYELFDNSYISFANRSLFLFIFSINLIVIGLSTFVAIVRDPVNRDNGNYLYMKKHRLKILSEA